MRICDREIKVKGRVIKIGRLDGDGYKFLDEPGPVIDDIRRSGARVDLFTFIQRVFELQPRFSYPMELDNFAALPVSTFDHWWAKQVDSKARNMVRKSEKKGAITREVPFDDTLVQGIWEIYNECPVRQGKPFIHYGKDLERVRSEAATFLNSSVFIGTFLQDKLIGFAKLTSDDTNSQASLMHIIAMTKHRDKAPTNALIAQAVRSCADRKIPYLAYASFAYGNKQEDSLSDFKRHNGFQRVNVPRYYVPLTRTGRAALRLGLHHSLVDHVPESVISRLREIRNYWYNRKLHSATEAS